MRLLALSAALLLAATEASAASFALSDHCPPSFEQRPDGRCELVTLYSMYTTGDGQGGMRVPLPPMKAAYTPRQIDLGRLLFFDSVLSGDGRTSCAHCHHPDLGYADGRRLSMGAGGKGVGPARQGGVHLARSAPSLWNVGFLGRLFWDGRASSLQSQAAGPLFDPKEMANSPDRVLAALSAVPAYRKLFAQAYRRDTSGAITLDEVTNALAAFQSSLVSINSRFDRYAHGDESSMSASETRGWNVFRSFVGRCAQCHVPPLFSSDDLAVVGAPPTAGQPYDRGAGAVPPGNALLNGAFKVPTLRNVALTAPYFQAGQFADLAQVVDFYNARRGHAVPPGESVQVHWHVHMQKPELSPQNVADLTAFLGALTDTSLEPQVPASVPSGLPVVPRILPVKEQAQ